MQRLAQVPGALARSHGKLTHHHCNLKVKNGTATSGRLGAGGTLLHPRSLVYPQSQPHRGVSMDAKQQELLRRHSVENIAKHHRTVNIEWKDSHQSRFHFIWLRDNCKCHKCVDPFSGQKLYHPADIPADIEPVELSMDLVGKEYELQLFWSDRHKSSFNVQWLRDHCYAKAAVAERVEDRKAEVVLWTGKDLEAPPQIEFDRIMSSEEGVWEWLKQLDTYGFSLVVGLPKKASSLQEVTNRIAYNRPTFYGTFWDVKSVPEAINIAYTSNRLELHQDLMYYETPPGLQFLHCLKSSKTGGSNSFVDGFSAATILRKWHPEYFDFLTELKTTFHKVGKNHSLYYRRPIIDVDDNNEITALNFAPPFEGTHCLPYKHVENYYAAMRTLTKIIRDPENAVVKKLESGQMISFLNRRVLHARDAFDPQAGVRHLRGTYVDMDEFYSRKRVLQRQFGMPVSTAQAGSDQ